MKKLNLILIMAFILLGIEHLDAQPWMKPPYLNKAKSESSFYDIQNAFYSYWDGKIYDRGMGYNQFKRWEYIMEPKCYPDGKIPDPLKFYNEYKEFQTKNQNKQLKTGSSWVPLGLYSWTNGRSGYNPGNGRLNAVTVDMQDRNKIYVAAPSGGIWQTNDGGMTWNTTFDTMPVLGTSAVAIHPTNHNIIYIGTGDRDAWDTKGTGIYKSFDGGSTWNPTGQNFSPTYRNFNKIIINPLKPSNILAASSDGIYRSKNDGATWQLVYNSSEVKDLKFKPNDTAIVYGSGEFFIRSNNGGSSFSKVTNGIPSDTVRIEIDVTKNNDNFVYAVVSRPNNTFEGVYLSRDAGQTFEARCNAPNILGYAADGSDKSGQAWYDLAIAVSPFDSNEVFVGGINVWKSIDGGETFTINTMWKTGTEYTYIHCDIHSLNFYGDTLYCGSDGGIFYTSDHGTTWNDLSNGLGISQFYRMGSSEAEPYKLIAGGQDIGSNLCYNGDWTHVYGADGMEAILNNFDHYNLYISSQYGGIKKSEDGGKRFHGIKPYDSIKGNWVTPYVLDEINGNTLWSGYQEVYKSIDRGEIWTQISTNLTGGYNLNCLVVSPSNHNYIFASRNEKLYTTTDGGINWISSTPSSGRYITSIAVDPNNPSKLWITASSSTSDRVLYSKNGGNSFINITGNLTNLGFNCITFQKNAFGSLYLGTEVGVFFKDSTMTDWIAFNEDLPNVGIRELEVNYSIGKIRAATYGRGIWEASLNNTTSINKNDFSNLIIIYPNPVKNNLNIEFHKNLHLDINVEVYNVVGTLIYSYKAVNSAGTFSIDLSKLVTGTYFLKISNNQDIFTKKFIVVN